MSEEKKLSAEELDSVAGGIGGDVSVGSSGGDTTILDQSVNTKIDESVKMSDDHSTKIDDHSTDVRTKIDSKVQVKSSIF